MVSWKLETWHGTFNTWMSSQSGSVAAILKLWSCNTFVTQARLICRREERLVSTLSVCLRRQNAQTGWKINAVLVSLKFCWTNEETYIDVFLKSLASDHEWESASAYALNAA